ncbi:hypothetical protein BC941DRAFT_400731 [Chlamydoabsidia padenii]|nr:hypothetical protein BC941DRAFT_400731 [Chlamydoabsidia padenii]
MRRKTDLQDPNVPKLYPKSQYLQDRDSGYTEPESDMDTPPRGVYPFSDDEDQQQLSSILNGHSSNSWSSFQPPPDSTSYHSYQADKAIESIKQYEKEKEWKKVLKHKSGVIVYMLQQGSNDKLTVFKGELVIKGFTPQSVFYVIGMRKLWDDLFEDGNLIQNLNDTTSITYETYRSNGSTKAYDLTLVEKIDCSNDGVIIFACTSVETNRVAKQPGRARHHVKLHGWILKLLPTIPPSTHVTFITEEIVRGWIPGLTKKSLARKPLVIASIDDYLKHKAQTSVKKEQQPKPINKFLSPLSVYTRRRPSIMTPSTTSSVVTNQASILTNPPPRHSSLNSQQTTSRSSSLARRITFGDDAIIPPTHHDIVNSSTLNDADRDSTSLKLYPLARHRAARKESLTNYKRLLSSDMDEWKLVEEKEGVKIFSKAVQGSALPILRGDGLIEGPWTAEQVCSVVQCFGARTKWDDSFEGGDIVERFSQKEYLVSLRMKSLFPINSRDFCLLTQIDSDPRSETIHVVSTSVSDHLIPENPDTYTRGRIIIYGWTFQVIKNNQGKRTGVKMTLISHMDLAGTTPLPFAIIRRLTIQVPTSVLHVQRYLTSYGCPPYIRRVAGKVLWETYDTDTRHYKLAYIAKHSPSRRHKEWCTDIRTHLNVYPHSFHVVTRPDQHVSVVQQLDGIRIYTRHEDLEGAVIEINVEPKQDSPPEDSSLDDKEITPTHPLMPDNTHVSIKDDEYQDLFSPDKSDLPTQTRQRSNSIIVIGDQLSFNGPQLSVIFLLMLFSYYVGKLSCRC